MAESLTEALESNVTREEIMTAEPDTNYEIVYDYGYFLFVWPQKAKLTVRSFFPGL